jgi:uncharacterized protein (DUF4415 family)
MARTWPSFITSDLGDSAADQAELLRRWEAYDRDMKALIAGGGIHQDEDGWWVDDATGELIGPDPEIERPLTEDELSELRPFEEVHPELAESIRRSRGRPPLDSPKKQVSLRLDSDVLDRLRQSGPGWQSRINEVLKKVVGL